MWESGVAEPPNPESRPPGLRLPWEGPETARRHAVFRRRLVRRGDTEEQAFIEGAPDEIDADGKPGGDWTNEARAVTLTCSIPHLCRETRGHGDHREALLPER